MKKIIIINLLALFVASYAFADGTLKMSWATAGLTLYGSKTSASTPGAAGTIIIGKTSTNVAVGWNTGALGYALNTQHQQGVKAYGTSFDSTAMYILDVKKGELTAAPGTSDTGAFTGDWKTM